MILWWHWIRKWRHLRSSQLGLLQAWKQPISKYSSVGGRLWKVVTPTCCAWIKTIFWSPDRLPSAVNLLAQTPTIRYLKDIVHCRFSCSSASLVIASASALPERATTTKIQFLFFGFCRHPAPAQHPRSFPLAFCGGGGETSNRWKIIAYIGIHSCTYWESTELKHPTFRQVIHGTGPGYILAKPGCKYRQTDVKRREGTLDFQNLKSLKLVLASRQ